MKRKVAIIDTLGAHGGAFHFYTFGQSMGLINCGVEVSLYTNNETSNPSIKGLKFFSFYKDIFYSKVQIINGFQWIIGSIKSIFHARFSGISVFHFHIFYTNILVLFNIILVKLLFGKIVLTIHDVKSFSDVIRVIIPVNPETIYLLASKLYLQLHCDWLIILVSTLHWFINVALSRSTLIGH